VKLSKGTFATLLASTGMTNATVKNKKVTVPVSLVFNGGVFQKLQTETYTATAGKTGSAK